MTLISSPDARTGKARIAAALWTLLQQRPYFAPVLAAFRVVESANVPTCGVSDDLVLYFSPTFTDALPLDELTAVLAHEVGHVLMRHADRVGSRDHGAWNVAGDAEINDDLVLEGFTLPEDGVLPAKLGQPDGLTAETYYAAARDAAGDSQGQQGSEGSGEGSEGSNGPGDSDAEGSEGEADGEGSGGSEDPGSGSGSSASDSKGTGAGRVAAGDCGSCADGHARPWEAERGMDAAGVEIVRAQTAQQAAEHVRQHGQGSVPGWMVEVIADLLDAPAVPWRQVLRSLVARTLQDVERGRTRPTYAKPWRRAGSLDTGGIIMPGWDTPTARVGIVLDTSGSMGTAELRSSLTEIMGVLRIIRHAVVAVTDVEVHQLADVRRWEQIELTGRGGTDLRVGMTALAEQHVDAMIIVTDGYTSWPDEAPPVPVIVVLVGEDPAPAPPWAKAVTVPPEPARP